MMIHQMKSLPVASLNSYLKTCEKTGVAQETAVALLLTVIVDMLCDACGPRLAKEIFTEIVTSIEHRTS